MIVASAIAAAEWDLILAGWIAAGFTTAAMTADWTAVGFAWSAYDSTSNGIQDALVALSAWISAVDALAYDVYNLVNDVKDIKHNFKDTVPRLEDAVTADEVANEANIWADPGDAVNNYYIRRNLLR